jgi:hypothetical protein
MEKVNYGGWPNCIRLTNGKIELIATTDVGPRIIRLGFVGGQNLMKEVPEEMGRTGDKKFVGYGGHRLWHAPEVDPRSYQPDNAPVAFKMKGATLKLTPPVEAATGMVRELEITLDEKENRVKVLHRLINKNMWDIEAAPWALSVMALGGRAIFPQEKFIPHEEYLLPARPIVLWHYSDMTDPRFIWGKKYIQFRQDPKALTKNKIGILNKRGWAAYVLKGDLFLKTVPYSTEATYVDFGCNCECFNWTGFIEIETLGPVTKIPAGGKVEHVENWLVAKVDVSEKEEDIDKKVLPLVGH